MTASVELDDLVARHAPMLERARTAIRERVWWSAFEESPSTKIWGEAAPEAGEAAFESLLSKDFPLVTPGASGTVASERSPYGTNLGITYPRLPASGVDDLMAAARSAMPAWRDAGPAVRAAVCVEIACRLHARAFLMAHAVMHTTGQGFVMAFQAGAANALDRGLEAIAAACEAMSAAPEQARWEKPRPRGEPQRMANRFVAVPKGVALVVGCATFPTWNGYPGLFASLVTGNPVVVKPHPGAVLPLALTVLAAQETLAEYGFDRNLVTLAVEAPGDELASALALRPEVRVVDFTGSREYGSWLETNARQAVVFAEKAGVNTVVIDSTDDLPGMAANLAWSLALYSGQMCTTPQAIMIPRGGFTADGERRDVDDFLAALESALDDLLGSPARASALLGAIVNDAVLARLDDASRLPGVVIPSKALENKDFPAAEVRTPLVVRTPAEAVAVYGHERFGPISFVVETDSREHSLAILHELTATQGALTASVYSTSSDFLVKAERVAIECGVSMSSNLTGDVYINQTSAFADFHGTGANPAANATFTDSAFVSPRFRWVQLRSPA